MNFFSMNFEGNTYDYEIFVKKPSGEILCKLPKEYVVDFKLSFSDTSTIKMRVPKYEPMPDGTNKLNPKYDMLTKDKLIYLNDQVCFCIENFSESIEDTEEKEYKEFTASSREYKLQRKNCTIPQGTIQLKKDDTNVANGIFDYMENQTYSWKLGYLSDNAKLESINGGLNTVKYRYLAAQNDNWLKFLRNDVFTAFKSIILFDSVKKEVNVYAEGDEQISQHTGLTLSFKNFLKKINKDTSNDLNVTRLYVNCTSNIGGNSFDISGENPLGTTYIEDFTGRRKDMSDELNNALDRYNVLVEDQYKLFLQQKIQLDNLNSQLTTIELNNKSLGENLKVLNLKRAEYTKLQMSAELAQNKADIDVVNGKINTNLQQINAINSQKNDINVIISNIAKQLDKKTSTDSQGLIFTNELLYELDDFIEEGTLDDSTSLTAAMAYDNGTKTLTERQIPVTEFTVDVFDFMNAIETKEKWNNRLKLGSFINVRTKEWGLLKLRLVEYSHSPLKFGQAPTLKITLSNKPYKFDDVKRNTGYNKISTTHSTVSNNNQKWSSFELGSVYAKDVKENGLNLATSIVNGRYGNSNIINLDSGGLLIIDAADQNKQLYIGSGLIAISTNGFESSTTCIDAEGVIGQTIVGKIIVSSKLSITTELGDFYIGNIPNDPNQGFGLTIKENEITRIFLGTEMEGNVRKAKLKLIGKTGKVLLSEDGLINHLVFCSGLQNVDDSGHPLNMRFYIPENTNIIHSVKLSLSLEKYRVYETGAASGGSTTSGASSSTTTGGAGYTSASTNSGSAHRHLLFKLESTTDQFMSDRGYPYTYANNDSGAITTSPVLLPFGQGSPNFSDIWSYGAESSHFHNFTVNSHEHNMEHTHNISSHTHDLVYQINEFTRANHVKVIVDNVDIGASVTSDFNDLDISQYVKTNGWHTISFSSSTLGAISATLVAAVFLTS